MNLQRYVSTVYSEQIKKKDYSTMDKELSLLVPGLTFEKIRDSYTKKYTPYQTNDENVNYMLHNLLFEKVFENTVGKLFQRNENSIILFPVYHDIDSKNRLREEISSIYRPILGIKDTKTEFERSEKNNYMFVPVFSDEEESAEEYKDRLTLYFNRWFDFIQESKPKPTNLRPPSKPKFDTICYTVDLSGNFFTQYYNTKLKDEKTKIVNQLLSTFLERLGLNSRSEVKDPISQLTPENATRKYKADGKVLKEDQINALLEVVKTFTDLYKRTNDKEYLKTATARDQQSIFRIFYRVNRTDDLDDFMKIRPGAQYIYKLRYNDGETKVGYFIEKKDIQTTYTFREYRGLTAKYKKLKEKNEPTKKEPSEKELYEEGDAITIETTTVGPVIYFKQNIKGRYENKYDGMVEFDKELHNYEKYKWFNFRDMNGSLNSDTTIKFYENILFDKKSLIGFLTEKKELTKETKLNQMFLKINQNDSLLLEYAGYIKNSLSDSNEYVSETKNGKLEKFIENNKKSIVSLLFETNQLLYLTAAHSSEEKTDISKNYKMVQYKYYQATDEEEAKQHFKKKINKDEESSYCARSDKQEKCELLKVIKTKKKDAIEYAIVIVDVTRENIEVDSALKSKTNCKKLHRSLLQQLQPYFIAFAPRWGGSKKKKKNVNTLVKNSRTRTRVKMNVKTMRKRLRTRRRKYRH